MNMAPLPPKQYLLLLILCILISIVLLLCSLSSSDLNPEIIPQISQIPGPNTGGSFTFIIKVLTYNRPSSLVRCLNSLSRAHYDVGDKVHLHVFIDNFRQDSETPSADTDEKLRVSKEILDFVDGFFWEYGEKVVHYRSSNAGLQAQWIESWWPSSDNEFAFVVEDDLEVSPLYYRFLKAMILNYYFKSSNFSPFVYGASLQKPRFVPGKHGNKMNLGDEDRIFLYQLVGTWGQLLFPKPWKEFRRWYDVHKAKGIKPFLEGMVTNGWYKKLGEKIWTPWFIKFIHSHGYFNLYTNFPNGSTLSISHRDAGVNYRKTAGPDSSLMDETSVDSNLLKLHPFNSLKWYDFCFREVLHNRIIKSSKDLCSFLQTLQKNNYIVLVSIRRGAQEKFFRNMLCYFEKLNIQNYLLIGPSSDFLLDLARRGHPVIDASQFSVPGSVSDSSIELIKENVVKTYAIKKSLELGYSMWFLDGNLLPLGGNSFDDEYDFSVGRSTSLLFLKSSPFISKIWTDDFVYNVASRVISKKEYSSSHDSPFLFVIEKLMNERNIKQGGIDEINMKTGDISANMTSFLENGKFMFWSDETGLDTIQEQLDHLGLWVIDADSSCTAVVCHQS